MTKHRSHKRRAQSKTMRRAQRGGDLAGNPASAWGWTMGTVGNGWTQFMNSLTLQPGQSASAMNSNNIVPVNNSTQRGGKRKRQRGKHSGSKHGGNIGSVLSQAAVPGALILMNNAFGKGRRTRKHR